MAHALLQIPVNCPRCGEYLYRIQQVVYNVGVGSESRELDPTCKCEGLRFIQLLRSADKIVPLTMTAEMLEKYHPPSEYGPQIENLTGRHAPQEKSLDDDGPSTSSGV